MIRSGKKVYKYTLTISDEASRFKEAEPLIDKTSTQVGHALKKITTGAR